MIDVHYLRSSYSDNDNREIAKLSPRINRVEPATSVIVTIGTARMNATPSVNTDDVKNCTARTFDTAFNTIINFTIGTA